MIRHRLENPNYLNGNKLIPPRSSVEPFLDASQPAGGHVFCELVMSGRSPISVRPRHRLDPSPKTPWFSWRVGRVTQGYFPVALILITHRFGYKAGDLILNECGTTMCVNPEHWSTTYKPDSCEVCTLRPDGSHDLAAHHVTNPADVAEDLERRRRDRARNEKICAQYDSAVKELYEAQGERVRPREIARLEQRVQVLRMRLPAGYKSPVE